MDLSRLGRTLGLTIGVAAGLAGVGAWAALRRPLPRSSGALSVPGLGGQVRIIRDRWGVPHIYADSAEDAFAGLGYAHAQDRLWQMELNRRTGHGQLAELLGPVALSTDRFLRVMGFGRVARAEAELLDDETRTALEAYLRGVNGFIEANRSRLPLEFSLLRVQPRPWELADVLVWPKMMALSLCSNWTSELLNARILAAVGPERYAQLMPGYPDAGPVTVPGGIVYPPEIGAGAMRAAAAAAPFLGVSGIPQGSNAWVVAGERSATGRPLLADDPHLNLTLPAIWYQAHLEAPGLAVSGVTIPGTAGVVIGHNARIAWGVTNAMTDVQDLFIERFHPEDPLRYAYQGDWLEATLVREEIVVKGQAEPHVEEVRVTRHGPVIDTIAAPDESLLGSLDGGLWPAAQGEGPAPTYGLALRWNALDPDPRLSRAVLKLNRAADWDEFREALADWSVPAQNFVYADVDGNYGYALGGDLPIRAAGDGSLPVPGWDGAYEWTGTIPAAALPAALNPPEGVVVSANNRIAGGAYRYAAQIRGEWMNPYRARRIGELLAETEAHDPASFARIHVDVRSLPGLELARLLADLPLEDELEIQARDLLLGWDGELSPDSVAGTIYDSLRFYLERQAYAELGDLLDAQAGQGAFASLPGANYLSRAVPDILARIAAAEGPERADPWLGEGCTWNQVLKEALALAVDELSMQFGEDPKEWTYGRVHSLTLRHPLGNVPALAPIFNRGPWPTGGDLDTVAQAYIPRETGSAPIYQAPSYRQICDPADWDNSRAILPSGQSGHPASPNYIDMNSAWRSGEYHPMLWSREKVEEAAVSTLTLEPEAPPES